VILSSLLAVVTQILKGAGVPSPRVDAERLIEHVLGLSRSELYLEPERQVSPEEVARITELAGQRADRLPLQHVLGECEFMSLTFRMRPGVFIPRPETEVLVEAVVQAAGGMPKPPTVLDLGTGSGVIAISLAMFLRPELVVACDISSEAVEIASENAILNGVSEKVRFVVADAAGFIRDRGEGGASGIWRGFDIVACNPPYVATGEIAGLEPEVRDHDPLVALDGGGDGTKFIDGIVPRLTSIISEGGIIALEIGSTQAERVTVILERSGFRSVATLKDFNGMDRVVTGRLG
jgi:release factor glutamine methyltransferase